MDQRITQIKERGVLRMSTIVSPLTHYTAKHALTGIDYELARRFADSLGVKLKVTLRPSIEDLFDDLEDDKADIIAAGLIYNPERLSRFRAGPGYYTVSQQLVYRIGHPKPKSLANLRGELTVASDSIYASTLNTAKARSYPNLSWTQTDKQSPLTLLRAVAEGKLDYTIGNSVSVAVMQRVYPQLAVAFDISKKHPVTWYLPRIKDYSLDKTVFTFFNNINSDGVMARMTEKYLGHMGTFNYIDTLSFLKAIDTRLPEIKPLFIKYAQTVDWKLLASVAWQESRWDPNAVSPTGVRGMMMLTRQTARSMNVSDRTDIEESIRGGSQYLQQIIKELSDSIPKDERIWFALAAYNMGYSRMLDARKLTEVQKGNPDSWADVKLRLPLLSQKRYYSQPGYSYARGQEAYNYVENIRRYHQSLVGYLEVKNHKLWRQRAPDTQLAMEDKHKDSSDVAID